MTALGDSLQPGFAPLRDHGYGTKRLRHGPYVEWLDGVSDALAYRLRSSRPFGPYATAAIRPRRRLSGTTGPRFALLGRQRTNRINKIRYIVCVSFAADPQTVSGRSPQYRPWIRSSAKVHALLTQKCFFRENYRNR